MPRPIQTDVTIRKLLLNTYQYKANRFENMDRDVLRTIQIKKISVYDHKKPGEARTKYEIRSFSYPQYSPYFTKKDSRGRSRSRQRTTKHEYDVTIQLEWLSIDSPVKLRTGSAVMWDFSSKGKDKKLPNGKILPGSNQLRGRNGDFFFRLEYVYSDRGCLFGKCFANGPPRQTNPNNIAFLDKHMLRVITKLLERGVLEARGGIPRSE